MRPRPIGKYIGKIWACWIAAAANRPPAFVQKGFKFFTMPWGPWAKAGIQNGLSGIKR